MIYGNRFYAFETKPVKESTEAVAQPQITFESLIESFDTVLELSKLTENDELMENYSNLLEQYNIDTEIVEEGIKDIAKNATGANLEYTKIFKDNLKEYKENLKAAGQACKKKNGQDFVKAQKLYLKAADNAKNIIKDFDSVKTDTLSSALLGDFIFIVIHALLIAITWVIGLIPGIGAPLFYSISAEHLIGLGHETINMYKNSIFKDKDSIKEEDINKTWNLYKNKLESGAKFLLTVAQDSANACGKSAKIKAQKEKDNK